MTKRKVTFTNSYSGSTINMILNLPSDWEQQRWQYSIWDYLSDYQRKRGESFFGSEKFYYCKYELAK